jgi:hypothetical protein
MDVKPSTEQCITPPRPICWRSPSRFIVGCDLGQAADPTAVCVLENYAEREDPAEPMKFYYDVRHLMRLPLGMSYPAIVHDVGTMLQRPPLDASSELVIDETGVGRAVGDIFLDRGLKPIRVTITAGGDAGTMTGNGRYSVSKSFLVSNLDAKMHTGELRFAKELREAPAMEADLKDFRRHVSEAGRYSFEARSGAHDDLVLAVAIALWRATTKKPSFSRSPSPPRVILMAPK